MTRIHYMWRYYIVSILVLVGCNISLAQNVVFVAQAATDKIGVQDRMEIQYTIQNAGDLQALNPPANLTKDFVIVGGPFSQQFSNMTIVNGKMTGTQGINITYVIQPRKVGNYVLGPAVAKDAAGHTYQSNQLNIQVVQGTVMQQRQQSQDPFADFFDDPFTAMQRRRQQQMQALRQQQAQQQPTEDAKVNLDKDLFIRVTVDKDKVRVGEQITATYKLYARIPMNCAISKLPSLNGFWTQDFELPKGNMKPVEEILDGKKYQVFTLKKSALFPQQIGTLELDPAEAEGVARVMMQARRSAYNSPFDDPFFQNAFGSLFMDDPFFNQDFFGGMAYKDVKVHLKSKPVKINVTPLPEDGKPADYTGAVGNFTIKSKIDKTNLTTDDVANLQLTISGSGNLKLIEAPKLNLPNGLTSLDPVILDTITGRTTTISGSKIITYPITPNTAGEYTIPPAAFTFYNTQTGKYITLNTEAIKLNVKQGKSGGTNNAIAIGDIHGIQTKPLTNVSYNSKPLLFTVGYWSLYATPLLAFMGIAFWRRREEELSKDTVLLKNRRANKVALKRLATAQTHLTNKQEKAFYEEISKAVWLYLSDKLNIPLSALSHQMANEAMSRKNIPADLMARTERIVTDCETALYAGYNGIQQMNNTYNEAIDIISKLEDCFKK
ncbi:hypothetical protein CAP35_07135 [Chitinophagaceae bacterium IBVUCB1]|nr:hypothetical protein CAP35_07135 [Chitinophagaceae bacterium IBVUCB1]